jgi:hypothetical protein
MKEEIIQVWEEEREELKEYLIDNNVRNGFFVDFRLNHRLKSFLPKYYWKVWGEDR